MLMRNGPLPSSISNETVPLDHRRADATIAPRTTTSSASSAFADVAGPHLACGRLRAVPSDRPAP